MKPRKIMYALAGLLALVPLGLTGAAQAASANSPDYGGDDAAYTQQLGTNWQITLSSGVAYLTHTSSGQTFDLQSNNTLQLNQNSNQCLRWDQNGNGGAGQFDLATCNASSSAFIWGFGTTSHFYSEMYTNYNNARGDCVYGFGGLLSVASCNSNTGYDRWHWYFP